MTTTHDIYDASDCSALAVELQDTYRVGYFDRLTFAAAIICDIQDAVNALPGLVAQDKRLPCLYDDGKGLTATEMIKEIVTRSLQGYVFDPKYGEWNDEVAQSRQILINGKFEPSSALLYGLELKAWEAVNVSGVAAIVRMRTHFSTVNNPPPPPPSDLEPGSGWA